ncbi:CHAP domain-containing protein [Ameyamaea chiangmaiensis]
MIGRRLRALALLPALLGLAACGGGYDGAVQCAPYARSVTGLRLSGAAAGWWRQSNGVYAHAQSPRSGDVLVFRATSRMPSGHVSVVRRVVGARTVLVDQANWRPGRVEHGVPVIDVSRRNDWTAVRVWWGPIDGIGTRVYPTYGFIEPVAAQLAGLS